MNKSTRIVLVVIQKIGFSETYSSFVPFALRYGVTSTVNSKYPPVLDPALCPLTNTEV
jgi:hypothetical protein